jgi:sterol desaturase/sphingolipid hydroxylase (fatty acid hydroxylase superfamily)
LLATFEFTGVRYRYLLSTFFCYVPLALGLGVWAWQTGTLPGSLWPIGIALGVGCWTLIEYLLHRFVLHLRPHTLAIRRTIEHLHLGHHREPSDEAKVTVPVYGSMPIAVVLLALFRLLTGSWEVAALLMIGSIGGYLAYETVHFRIHCQAAGGRWLWWQRKQHFFHHFKDQGRCFGVTTALWDWVFGTATVGHEPRWARPGWNGRWAREHLEEGPRKEGTA